MANPCCCVRLQRGVQILAVLEILSGAFIFLISWVALYIAMFNLSPQTASQESRISETAVIVLAIVSTIAIITSTCDICISIWLLLGANQRNVDKCRQWVVIQCILLVVSVIAFFIEFFSAIVIWECLSSLLRLSYQIYMIWVVTAFITELKR